MRVFGRHQMGSAERHCLNCRPKEKSCHLASGPGQYQEPALNARRTRNARRKYLEAAFFQNSLSAFFQNSLSISILYSHNAPRSMFLWRLRSIRLQKNGFQWACRGIFSKHIAPKSPAGWPYHPREGSFRLRGTLMAAGGRKRRITYSANRSQRHRRRNI